MGDTVFLPLASWYSVELGNMDECPYPKDVVKTFYWRYTVVHVSLGRTRKNIRLESAFSTWEYLDVELDFLKDVRGYVQTLPKGLKELTPDLDKR